MKTTPILFSGPMVRAILDGRKTVTRRVVKPQPNYVNKLGIPFYPDGKGPVDYRLCPYGTTGDQIWVKETFGCIGRSPKDGPPPKGEESTTVYRATSTVVPHVIKWRPSIHMPRWASRITLEIVGVRAERLQDITEADAIKEGAFSNGRYQTEPPLSYPVATFKHLWESINGPGSWELNPWVWVVEFRRLLKPQGEWNGPTGYYCEKCGEKLTGRHADEAAEGLRAICGLCLDDINNGR